MRFFPRAVFALLLPVAAFAQVAGNVNGLVTDASGAVIPGAQVGLRTPGGSKDLFSATTSKEGTFTMLSVPSAQYDLAVEAAGFGKVVVRGIQVDPGRTLDVPVIKLDVAKVAETVEVGANVQTVQTSDAEVSTTITNKQLQNLPITDRSPLGFMRTQVGVNSGRGSTTIDGQRPTYVNVTMEGINIQDNYIRTNDADFLPNLLLLDQVAEMTVGQSNASALHGGGSAQVSFVAPSGSNKYHGNAYWSNRNSYFAANTFFNNQSGTARPFLNLNQLGGSVSGFIIRDKLYFYTNYEAYRQRAQTTNTRTVLTPDARNGIFTYVASSANAAAGIKAGDVVKINVLTTAKVSADPAVAKILADVPANYNSFLAGDSTASLIKNTAGYTLLQRNNRTRDNVTAKLDYIISSKHSVAVTYLYNRDLLDRADADATFHVVPNVQNADYVKLLSTAWRSTFRPTLTNEVRFGFNLAPAVFPVNGTNGVDASTPAYFLGGLNFTNPQNTFLAQGRFTNTFNLADNASWVHGKHTLQFGFQGQVVHINEFNYGSTVPSYSLGLGNRTGLTGLLPGASSTDTSTANTLLAVLAGDLNTDTVNYNVTSRTSGYTPKAGNIRNFIQNNVAFYGMDTWKLSRRLTATLGLRWDYYLPVDERDGLALLPVVQGGNIINTVLSNASLDFAGNSTGHPFYKKDLNNFAPNVGLAWDPRGDGKTAVRLGYSIAYVNDNIVRAVENAITTNSGLSTTVSNTALSGTVTGGLPAIATPAFNIPTTFANNFALNVSNAQATLSPDLVTPYVQQWNIGVQHAFDSGALRGTLVDVRYVGNHATKQLRGFDYNQVQIDKLLPDFLKAQSNGYLALAKNPAGGFDPSYNPAIPGSQPLPFISSLPSGGLLTSSTVRTDIQTSQVGELANFYLTGSGLKIPGFFPSPYGLGMNVTTNYGNATFNALQIDVRRRLTNGLQGQFNYQWSKALSDTAGAAQTNFEPFLDNHNAKIEKAPPADFDLRHVIKFNAIYELPMGPGHKFNPAHLGRVLGGWNVSTIFTRQSGNAFSVTGAGRGTLNRAARSGNNEANPLLSGDALNNVVQFRQTPNGPWIIAASAIGSDGRGVAADGAAFFTGQAFSLPGPGQIGALQRNYFNGPWVWDMDFHVAKVTKITERQSIEFRMESTNVFNHPTFYLNGDLNPTSATFGKITNAFYGRRLVQFALYYRF